jgi:hypothetical protein
MTEVVHKIMCEATSEGIGEVIAMLLPVALVNTPFVGSLQT